MTRAQLIVLSVVCCGFGLLALYGSGGLSTFGYVVNFGLAVVLAIMTGRDLASRGVRVPWLVGLSYVAAPLIGLILYGVLSARPSRAEQTAASA